MIAKIEKFVDTDMHDDEVRGVEVTLTLTVAEMAILNSAMWKAYNITQDESGGCKCDHCKDFHVLALCTYAAIGEAWDAQYELARDI